MKTRERILVQALALFNEAGTGAVSTNHIAEALGISPGNLYYHFRNKEEIIRALFARLFSEWETQLVLPTTEPLRLGHLYDLVRTNFTILSDYRFIYRELTALLRQDDELRAQWLAVRERGLADFHAVFAIFAAADVLRSPDDEDAVSKLAELCWLISEFWLASGEVSGHAVDAAWLEHGIVLMRQTLRPYVQEPIAH